MKFAGETMTCQSLNQSRLDDLAATFYNETVGDWGTGDEDEIVRVAATMRTLYESAREHGCINTSIKSAFEKAVRYQFTQHGEDSKSFEIYRRRTLGMHSLLSLMIDDGFCVGLILPQGDRSVLNVVERMLGNTPSENDEAAARCSRFHTTGCDYEGMVTSSEIYTQYFVDNPNFRKDIETAFWN